MNGNPALDADYYWEGADDAAPTVGDPIAADTPAEPEPLDAEAPSRDLDDYATGGGWYLIDDEKVQGREKAQAALDAHLAAWDDEAGREG